MDRQTSRIVVRKTFTHSTGWRSGDFFVKRALDNNGHEPKTDRYMGGMCSNSMEQVVILPDPRLSSQSKMEDITPEVLNTHLI